MTLSPNARVTHKLLAGIASSPEGLPVFECTIEQLEKP